MLAAPFYCSVCGAANGSDAEVCFACGKPLHMPALSTAEDAAPHAVLIQQRYRILSQIGQGGFGAVYRAADTKFGNRMLALKEMNTAALGVHDVQEATEAFQREALLLAGLTHPNLPRIYDQFSEAGHWYLVMDYIEGETLDIYLQRMGNRLPTDEVLDIGLELCTVLNYLHTHQPPIIFRDLKPANVMRTPEGHLLLIDFGIARYFKPGQAKDTIALGSPGFAAPEQYGKAQTTPRADIYSLGATLHAMLSGIDPAEEPFHFEPVEGLSAPYADLNPLLLHMLEMNAHKRPDSIAEVKAALQHIQAQQSLDGQLIGGSGVPAGPAATNAFYAPSIVPTHTSPPTPVQASSSVAYPNSALVVPRSQLVCTYADHANKIRAVAWSPDGTRIASASKDGRIHLWDPFTGERLLIYREHFYCVNTLAWSPDNQWIASAGEGKTVDVWNAKTGSTRFTYNGHASFWRAGSVTSVSWSPDGNYIASGGHDRTIQFCALHSGVKALHTLHHSGAVRSVAWSPQTASKPAQRGLPYPRLASGGFVEKYADTSTHIWDLTTGKRILDYSGHNGAVWAMSWSPDGTAIVSAGSDMRIRVWKADSGTRICSYDGHQGTAYAVAWSPDGTRIASGGADSTTHVWDAKNGETKAIYFTPSTKTANAEIRTVAWSPDSQYIVTACAEDTVIQVWKAP